MIKLILIILTLLTMTGCASVYSHFPPKDYPKISGHIYPGTRSDINMITCPWTSDLPLYLAPPISLLYLIDMPFSFVMDTIFLPKDIFDEQYGSVNKGC